MGTISFTVGLVTDEAIRSLIDFAKRTLSYGNQEQQKGGNQEQQKGGNQEQQKGGTPPASKKEPNTIATDQSRVKGGPLP